MNPIQETENLVWAALARGLTLEAQTDVAVWADRYRMLSGTNAEPGPWRTARAPFLREPMNDLSTSSPVEKVVIMKGAQVGGTEVGLNFIGYVIDHAPGVIMCVWPSIDMVRRNSRTRIEPLLYETPRLYGKVAHPKSKDAGNTIGQKEFPGGSLIMTGANSATSLRSTFARYLVLDEVDAFPSDVDEEGDPVELAIQRTVTFRGRRKILMISTPTTVGVSRIQRAYEDTDQRRFFMPCRHCGTFQTLEWRSIQWPEGRPEQAYFACRECGGVMEESDKPALVARGEWRPTAVGEPGARGYHIPGLLSPFEPWGAMATDFLRKKSDPVSLKTWTNLKLGEAYEDRDTAPLAPDVLMARAEADQPAWSDLVPDGVGVIVAGVDTQDSWIEVELVGVGAGEETWSIDHQLIHGDTTTPEPWLVLDRLLLRRFAHARDGVTLPVAAVAVDSGGHRTGQVMRFSAERLTRRVWAIKGRGGVGHPPWPRRPPQPIAAYHAPVHLIGVDGLKSTLFHRLHMAAPGPGYCHTPASRDLAWYQGLVSERPVRRFVRGVARIDWLKDPGSRNEPLDCRVYAMAALNGLYAAGLPPLTAIVAEMKRRPLRTTTPPPAEIVPPPAGAGRPRVMPSKWISG